MTAKLSDDAAKAAIGAAARELRLPVVRSDAARLAESAQRSGTSYLGYLAEVLSAEVDARSERRRARLGLPRQTGHRSMLLAWCSKTHRTPVAEHNRGNCGVARYYTR